MPAIVIAVQQYLMVHVLLILDGGADVGAGAGIVSISS
jgi:hypothetical protein